MDVYKCAHCGDAVVIMFGNPIHLERSLPDLLLLNAKRCKCGCTTPEPDYAAGVI